MWTKENEAALAALKDLSEPLEPGPEGEELAELRPVEALPGHWHPWPPPDEQVGTVDIFRGCWVATRPAQRVGRRWHYTDTGGPVAPELAPGLLWRPWPLSALGHLTRVFGTAAAELDGDVLAVPTGEGLARYRAAEAAKILARFVDGFGAASWDRRDRVWEALSACRVEPEPWERPAREIALKAWRRIYEAQADLMGALVGVPGAVEADAVEARRLDLLAGKLEAVVREARALRRVQTRDEQSELEPPPPPPPGDPLDRS